MIRSNRRQFLEDSLLAAGVAAVPAARLVAAEGPEAGPNERLRAAVIGVRGRGGYHLQVLAQRRDTQVVYVCDADEKVGQSRCDQVERKQGRRPKFVRDMRRVFDDPAVDIVTTATPNHWHALTAIWAMQAGKDVYVEKPVSHNVSEGRRMVEAARKYKRICQTGTQCRSMAGSIQAIEFVRSGKIGEVKLARGLCYKRRKSIGPKGTYEVPPEVDYDLWSGPAPLVPLTRPRFHYDWHWQRLYGNGDIGNQGPHQMDLARWGLGEETLCCRVVSYGGRLGYEDAGDTANTQTAIYEFPDGKTLVFEVRGLETELLRPHPKADGARIGVIFYGTEGYVVLTSYTAGAAFDLDGNLIQRFTGGGDHFENFIQAVRSRQYEDLAADILEGHLSCALSHLANVSYYLGETVSVAEARRRLESLKTNEKPLETLDRVVSHLKQNGVDLEKTPMSFGPQLAVDPQKETITSPPDAVPLCTRDYRKPFVVPPAGQV
ncbi:MAG TPA: Gfo/Idh/MocA family oxidoreductase [Planctomycetaceae bacterium]|nr:Gfo/Idh/MocA family oxidoreductase [Planctomycetaceae bacterium]